MKKNRKSTHKKNNTLEWMLLLFVALLVLGGLGAVLSSQKTGRAVALPSEVGHDSVKLSALCGVIPMTSAVLKLDKYSSVGELRQGLLFADLSSTLPLPVACVFDCGLRVLAARNEADFAELMAATNFGQTLSDYSCKLPFVLVTNLKGEKVRFS